MKLESPGDSPTKAWEWSMTEMVGDRTNLRMEGQRPPAIAWMVELIVWTMLVMLKFSDNEIGSLTTRNCCFWAILVDKAVGRNVSIYNATKDLLSIFRVMLYSFVYAWRLILLEVDDRKIRG